MFVLVCLSLFQQAIEAGEPRIFFRIAFRMFTVCTQSARITRLHVLQESYIGEDMPPLISARIKRCANTYIMYGILDHGFVGPHLK